MDTPWFPASEEGPAGGSFTTRCFNDEMPGPLLRVRPGDTVIIEYENELDLPSLTLRVLGSPFYLSLQTVSTPNPFGNVQEAERARQVL